MLRFILTLACAALTACAGAHATADVQPRPAALRGSRDFVAVDELRRYSDTGSLFDLLTRIRPQMVRARPGMNALRGIGETIDVFINGQYAGGAEVLRSLQPHHVAGVKMVQRSQAYVEYGGWLRGDHALFVSLLR
ncbi:MAG: hypothetical protein ACT4P7_06895 [Gemmatimonadaceae bacterium]